MNAELSPCLRTEEGARVPLTGVSAKGHLDGLLFELVVEQHYRNTSNKTIETIYTFPLPLHAVLLAFELDLNGRKHVATAFSRQQAERKYENAIDDGDSAALLVDNGNGLYTVTVANLKPGEEAIVRYRYAELLRANRNQIRLNLPTVIAPRYGNPADAHLDGPAIPGADVFIEYPFGLSLDIAGLTDATRLTSPSHEITTTQTDGGLTVEIASKGFLDRDFVLTVDHPGLPASTLIAADGEGFVALASAALPATEADNRPLVVKLLLDCSGSMGGDSIDAAKRALVQILGGLTEADRFSLTRFGSHVEQVTEGLEPADSHSIKPVTQLVQRLDADMGGTEMEDAIQSVLAIPFPKGATPDVVLITDGEVYSVEEVVETAANSGHRLFVVAIGAAPNEALARKVSERTGGVCDFVAAGERVEPAILRMFGRLRATPRAIESIQWSATPDWTAPLPIAVYPNDTIHLMAGFREPPSAPVTVTITGDKERASLALPLNSQPAASDAVPRLAAALRLPALPEEMARDLALRYQLVSKHTSLVLVAERATEDKVKELPNTIAVPHMLASGWGGAGVGAHPVAYIASAAPKRAARPTAVPAPDRMVLPHADAAHSMELLDTPAFMRHEPAEPVMHIPDSLRKAIVDAVLHALAQGKPLPDTIHALDALHHLPEDFKRVLRFLLKKNTGDHLIEALLRYLDRGEGRLDQVLPPIGRTQAHRFRELRRQFAEWINIGGPSP